MPHRATELPWLGPPASGLLVWALEPYFGGSHKDFLQGLVRSSRHDVALHTLPGRHWKWRMHGGAFALARRSREELGDPTGGPAPQVLFASSMLDVPGYLALAHPEARRAPVALYFHENQLTYPLPPGVERDLTYGLRQVAGALAAEVVCFNSEFHRREFLEAVTDLVEAVPDEPPAWVVEELETKARVLPVGCDLASLDTVDGDAGGAWGGPERGPLIVWNQRWEYDKAPATLFEALYALQEQGVPFRLAVAGSNRGLTSAEFVRAHERLEPHLVQWGRVESRATYASLLHAADVVVSTARHEFFGVAVVEALYCGCRPVLPRRLSYPGLVPAEVHDRVLYGEGELVAMLRRALEEPAEWSKDWQRTWVTPYDWQNIAPRYDEMLWECWDRAAAGRRLGWV